MNKYLVNIWVPFIEQEFEVYIPLNIKISLAKKLIASAIIELSNNNYIINNDFNLLDDKNKVYDDDIYVILVFILFENSINLFTSSFLLHIITL